jgi:hypothetical protein
LAAEAPSRGTLPIGPHTGSHGPTIVIPRRFHPPQPPRSAPATPGSGQVQLVAKAPAPTPAATPAPNATPVTTPSNVAPAPAAGGVGGTATPVVNRQPSGSQPQPTSPATLPVPNIPTAIHILSSVTKPGRGQHPHPQPITPTPPVTPAPASTPSVPPTAAPTPVPASTPTPVNSTPPAATPVNSTPAASPPAHPAAAAPAAPAAAPAPATPAPAPAAPAPAPAAPAPAPAPAAAAPAPAPAAPAPPAPAKPCGAGCHRLLKAFSGTQSLADVGLLGVLGFAIVLGGLSIGLSEPRPRRETFAGHPAIRPDRERRGYSAPQRSPQELAEKLAELAASTEEPPPRPRPPKSTQVEQDPTPHQVPSLRA